MTGAWPVSTLRDAKEAKPRLDQAIAALARRQHGVVSLGQLQALGLGASGVRARVASGRLHKVHRGVYSVGHSLLSREGHWIAAVIAGGPGAVLSHLSAAGRWGLYPVAGTPVHITTPRRAGRSRPGIRAHSGAALLPREIRRVDNIPCTSVARTLLDVAEAVDRRTLERMVDQAEVLRILDLRALRDTLSCANGRSGGSRLSILLEEHRVGSTFTRSELEERFLALCRTAGLASPEVNGRLELPHGSVEVDFMWRDRLLVVETDGHRFHGTRQAFERDRRRDQYLLAAGWRVMRCTWRQLTAEPDRLAGALRSLLREEPLDTTREQPPGTTR